MNTTIATIAERARQRAEEHERRMATDPEYRAEQEKRAAEERTRAEGEKREQERQRRAETAKRRAEKGIPEKFWPYLDAWRAGPVSGLAPSVEEAHRWAERFLREAGAWVFLFLAGSYGTGKTSAACRFLDAPRVEPCPFGGAPQEREAPGLFVTAEELTKASAFAADSLWNEARDVRRLVIDDLGAETLDKKDWALGNLTALLYHRHAHQLATVITMNLTRELFLQRFASHDGGRLRDRLRESAWFQPITGPSQRAPLGLEP